MSINVGMNLLWCVPGHVGGSEEYFVRQLIGLTEVDHEFCVTPYVVEGFAAAHPEVAKRFDLDVARIDGRSRPRRVVAESTWLARRQQLRHDRLAHHGGGTMPRRGVRPAVVTVHDLQYLTFPQYFSPVKRAYLTRRMPTAVRRADVVTVPTEYVKSSVVYHFDVDPDQVVVVPNGTDPMFGSAATPETELRKRYGLGDGPVIMFPAATFPHKRHDFVIDMMERHWRDPDLRLVLTGGEGLAEPEVAARSTGRVIRVGRVPSADRDGLLAMAFAMVFPSEYEGFGVPVIEAMMLGTPVIASDRTAVPEVLGGAGLCLPLQHEAWTDALDQVARRRSELVANGRVRASEFTSRRSAEALLSAYRLALA